MSNVEYISSRLSLLLQIFLKNLSNPAADYGSEFGCSGAGLKVEKEKHAKSLQIEEIRAAMDVIANEKATLEKQNKLLDET